jgi:hypothetical protein
MSRVLSALLGANEVTFRLQLQRLERSAGMPSADIRLAASVMQATKTKIRELGLDPNDTTGPELFTALQTRLRQDEVRLRSVLEVKADMQPIGILQGVERQLNKLDQHSDLYVVKSAVMKKIIKKLKPKVTMKRLGYRSMDSMLKHEPVGQLLAACQVTESAEWQEARLKAYTKLQPKDFEPKRPSFVVPTTKQWPKLADAYTGQHKQNSIVVPELGIVVILPMSQDLPGLAITTFVVSLHALNDMRALSAYMKLQQVRPDFGKSVASAIEHEPLTEAELGGNKLSWRAVYWFYGHNHASYHPDVFEPHVQPEDLAWHNVESAVAQLHPVFDFWEETEQLGLLDGDEAVSMNILDVALGVCNGFGYAERTLHHMREALGRELFARYLHQDNLQSILAGSLDRQLAPELEFDD